MLRAIKKLEYIPIRHKNKLAIRCLDAIVFVYNQMLARNRMFINR